jgi:hypothetical protein
MTEISNNRGKFAQNLMKWDYSKEEQELIVFLK